MKAINVVTRCPAAWSTGRVCGARGKYYVNGRWWCGNHIPLSTETTPRSAQPPQSTTRDEEIAALAERIFERYFDVWHQREDMTLEECWHEAFVAAEGFIDGRDAWAKGERDA